MTASVEAVDTTERSNLSGLSVTGVTFGAAAAGRVIVVCGAVNALATGCTINGVSATIQQQFDGATTYYAMAWAVVPTDTSGTVTWTAAGGTAAVNFFASAVTGAANATAYDAEFGPTDYVSIDTSGEGALVAYSINNTTLVTWTNATETADYQSAITSNYVSMAEIDNCTPQSGLLVGTGVNFIVFAVSFVALVVPPTLTGGFASVAAFAAADALGRCWLTQFRKTVPSAATTTGAWVDYSYFPGSPPANFYASAPSIAALIEADKGIRLPAVTPATQHLARLTLMTANTATAVNARQRAILCDYLLYYPFLDTDAIGEEQLLTNYADDPAVPALPRYTSGRVVAVGQSASSTIGTFTFTYTNQAGVPGRISQASSTFVIAGGGQIVSASGAGASFNPFLPLQAGDSGVSSIQSVTFTAAGGGLMALVIVKPLLNAYVTQECRTTSGVAFGAADEFMSVIHSAGAPRFVDGCVLNIIAQGNAGSLASSQLVGTLETYWS